MTFWVREVAGWVLVAVGSLIFVAVLICLANGRLFESGPLSFVGFVVFRGGIHLLKVAVASRLCQQAAAQLQAAPSRPAVPPSRPLPGVRPPTFVGTAGNGNAGRR